MTFSSAENSGNRKWNWNTKPSVDNLVSARSASSMCAVARPRMRTSPVVGRSSIPSRESSDDLPDPDGPVMAMNSLSLMSRSMLRTSVVGTTPGKMRVTLVATISAAWLWGKLMSLPE